MFSLSADLLLHGGRILTLDPQRPEAEAVAVTNGRILAIGTEDELRPFFSSHMQSIACAGKTVLPGFIDPHLHFFSWASRFCGVDLSTARSIAEIRQRLKAHLSRIPVGEWVRGYGYDEFFLAEKRHPIRQDLDIVSADQPILLRHRTGHAAVLNSAALRFVGIDQTFHPPLGGSVERKVTGEPTGVTYELEPFLRSIIPSLAQADFTVGLKQAGAELLRQGVTSFHDASVGNTLEDLSFFRRLHEEGVLTSRATVMIGIEALPKAIATGFSPFAGDEYVRLGSVKIMLHESRGVLTPSSEEVTERVLLAHRNGFQVAIHAVEEGPICIALEAIAWAQAALPRTDHRHRIEHCFLCPPPLVDALVETGSVVVTQPGFLHFYGEKYLTEIAPELHGWLHRTKSLLERGVPVVGGSDCPVAPLNPMVALQAALTRQAQNNGFINGEERLTFVEALELFTTAGAWVGFEERKKGRIAPGMMADLVILDKDIVKVAPEEIGEIKVRTTIIDGRIVWTAAS
ncbi:MAG: amidohydrolase [Candidatus Binatia bacterium]